MTEKKVIIYTDGACSGNPGPGGWGAVLYYGDKSKQISGGELTTTNNRMELMAVISALRILKKSCEITLYSDSKYIVDGASKWLANWKRKNRFAPGKYQIKNPDLWRQLDFEASKHNIDWHWVKGHADNPGNELADQLACSAIEKLNLNNE